MALRAASAAFRKRGETDLDPGSGGPRILRCRHRRHQRPAGSPGATVAAVTQAAVARRDNRPMTDAMRKAAEAGRERMPPASGSTPPARRPASASGRRRARPASASTPPGPPPPAFRRGSSRGSAASSTSSRSRSRCLAVRCWSSSPPAVASASRSSSTRSRCRRCSAPARSTTGSIGGDRRRGCGCVASTTR